MTRPETEPLLTEAEAAQFLAMAVATLQGWRYAGTGPRHFRINRSVRYRRSDLTAWLDTHASAAEQP